MVRRSRERMSTAKIAGRRYQLGRGGTHGYRPILGASTTQPVTRLQSARHRNDSIIESDPNGIYDPVNHFNETGTKLTDDPLRLDD